MPTEPTLRAEAAADPSPVLRTGYDGQWRIRWQDDGFDYLGLLKAFQEGLVQGTRLVTVSPSRVVHRVAYLGREFVIKFDRDVLKREKKPEKRLFYYFFGTQYSRLIDKTFEAVRKGCQAVQEIFLVAEKMKGRFCEQAWIVSEYVPGHSFAREEYVEGSPVVFRRPGPWIENVCDSLLTLHEYGIASNDADICNFVVTPEGQVKVIDLNLTGPMFMCKVNDVLKLRRNCGDVPLRLESFPLRMLVHLYGFWNLVLDRMRKLKRKPPAFKPWVVWEDYADFPERPVPTGRRSKATGGGST
ncbi:MAG: hypothetical protein LBR80_17985 [Deltaproteobacteria bacterium]|jgi:serine/threonine protein kinase|nr:hypothetical protein [Deltaproteobacteria bacterium]